MEIESLSPTLDAEIEKAKKKGYANLRGCGQRTMIPQIAL
jgi:hypothetical protein